MSGSPPTPLSPADESLGLSYAHSPGPQPVLFAVVDTEEEFDWSAPFGRSSTSVAALRHIGRVHSVFRRFGVTPTYVIDFPVASQSAGYARIKEFAGEGECTVGAHLHPWVTPPFAEALTRRNSFACNLAAPLEEAKLRTLKDVIGENLGIEPRVYKAGRYGFSSATAGVIERLGFDVDLSINPRMDYSAEHGPSFVRFDARPFFFGRRRLLEIPCSTECVGTAGRYAPLLHRVASTRALRKLRAPALLSRLQVADRLMLSPEGYTGSELRRLTRELLARGVRTFALTFHSPSVEPGHTPYVRTEQDLEVFLRRLERYLEFFFGVVGGTTMTPEAFRAVALSSLVPRPAAAGIPVRHAGV